MSAIFCAVLRFPSRGLAKHHSLKLEPPALIKYRQVPLALFFSTDGTTLNYIRRRRRRSGRRESVRGGGEYEDESQVQEVK
jgi:hypothetical protein